MRAVGNLEPQPWMTAEETRAILDALTARGSEVRFVGGCVRDALLKRPVTDIDIATHDRPETVLELVEGAGLRAIPTGIKHGTITAVVGDAHFEITTLRLDVETFGRHARVAFTDDWTADASRRDFTMNALFCGVDGTLYDAFGGMEDLNAGRVRFVGDARERIREDVLRLLRFFRFFAHYGVPPPDPDALAACRELAHLLPTLSAERVRAELLKILAAPDPAGVVRLMEAEGILEHLLPPPFLVDRLSALAVLEQGRGECEPIRRLAALLDTESGRAASLPDRLRLSNEERGRLAEIGSMLGQFEPLGDARVRRRWFYRHGAPLYVDLALLHRAGAGNPCAAADDAGLAAADAWVPPVFPLQGKDVLALGVESGPRVGELLVAVESWWLEHDFEPDRAACRARLSKLIEEGASSR